MRVSFYAAALFLLVSGPARAEMYYVAPWGCDCNLGSEEEPFGTIQFAAEMVEPGDVCIVRGGRYAETVRLIKSGTADLPIIFMAAPGEEVIVDGADPVETAWTTEDGRVFQTPLDDTTDQVFFQDRAMTLARWPNMTFGENWEEAKKWGRTGAGSDRGVVMSPELAEPA